MSLFILLYILISHKVGWGVEWYDWVLFALVFAVNFIKGIVAEVKTVSQAVSTLEQKNIKSYFHDVIPERKDTDERKK